MPPKEKPSKKAVILKQSKAIDDATFGLKNKNKSKKVQQFIDRVEKAVKFNPDANKAKEAKEAKKIAKQLQEEEMRILFNEGISNQFGKKKTHAKSAADAMGITRTNEELAKLLEEMSSDDESEDDENEYNKQSYNTNDDQDQSLEVIEIFREKTIEDIIEEQREKLAAQGKVGTPVTAESFAKWRAEKLAKRQADAEARMKLEQSKKKGSKGLSVLSGKELFNYNSALFVDDDAAIDANEEYAYEQENKLQEEEEEKRIQLEVEKAQEEQLRLAEIARLEDEENQRQDDEKRRLASLEERETFKLGNVIINRIVFDMTELEDLEPFLMDEETDDEEDEDDDDDEEGEEEEGDVCEDGEEEEEENNNEEESSTLQLESLNLEMSEHN